jgi:hypothetical protein
MLCIEKGQDRTKVLPSDALYPTCRASASNVVATGRMLDEESKCSVFKKSKKVQAHHEMKLWFRWREMMKEGRRRATQQN